MSDLIDEFFIKPILEPEYQGYNIVNTLVYGTALIAVAFFVVFPLLHKRGIKFDERFALAVMPYVILGASLRAINEFGLVPFIQKTINPLEPGFWSYTPGVWFLIFGITIFGLWLSRKIKKENYHKAFALIGAVSCALPAFICLANFTNWLAFLAPIFLTALLALLSKFFAKRFTKILENRLNLMAFSGQLLDSCATAVAVTFFSFREQHPISGAILSLSPLLFIAIKAAIVLLILYYIGKAFTNKNLADFARLFIIILGFATGLASVFKLGLA